MVGRVAQKHLEDVRWPVLEIGRNSVNPSTTPKRTASHQSIGEAYGEPQRHA